MSVLVLIVIILCCVVFAWSWFRPRHRSPPMYPGALPIIGHALLFIGDRKYLRNFMERVMKYSLKTGGACEIRAGFLHSAFVLTDPEDSLIIANSCLGKPYYYNFGKAFVGNGLVTAETSLWKTHRKLLNPAFNQQVLNTYVDDMNLQARSLVSQLASKAEKDPFDMRKYFINYTLSTVTRTSLGLNTNDQTTIDTEYAEAIEDLLAIFCDRFQKLWFHSMYIYNWSAMKFKENQLINNLKNIMNPLIHKRKSELKANENQSVYDDSTPENCTLRAGNSCIIGLYGLLRHPMWGADAEQFRPERWLDPATLPKHPGLHAAFSVGKRNCIGKLYSMMVMKTALAHILRQYTVIGDIDNVVCEYDVVLKPVEGHLIGLTLRT